jgi:ribosome biogenesis GTPase / thiamine phosphate phosphatase
MPDGVVVEYHREYCWVELSPEGEAAAREVIAKPRGRLELVFRKRERTLRDAHDLERIVAQQIAVGDCVTLSEPEPDYFVIEAVHERETWLLRKNYSRYSSRPQCVVANADQLAVVIAPNPSIKLNVVDRYFLAAIQGGLEPLLIVNKIDLDPALPESVAIRNYRELGYRVFFMAAKLEQGLAELIPQLEGKLTAFCGHSGVGKSTILQRLTGMDIAIAEVTRRRQQGRQTTTTSRLYHVPNGGEVLDTPGIREFVMAHLTWLDVHDYFADIARLTMRCAFRDCTHTVEPECAVRAAVEQKQLSAARLDSYSKLCEEVQEQAHTYEGT